MNAKIFERIPAFAAVVLVVLIVAACAIRLRGDEGQTSTPASAGGTTDPLTAKLMECRSVTYEQKDALSECRKSWAEQRRQFLGQTAPTRSNGAPVQTGRSLFVVPKDESRLPGDYPPLQQTGKD
jgi:conjugative transfer region protein TrbK